MDLFQLDTHMVHTHVLPLESWVFILGHLSGAWRRFFGPGGMFFRQERYATKMNTTKSQP